MPYVGNANKIYIHQHTFVLYDSFKDIFASSIKKTPQRPNVQRPETILNISLFCESNPQIFDKISA